MLPDLLFECTLLCQCESRGALAMQCLAGFSVDEQADNYLKRVG